MAKELYTILDTYTGTDLVGKKHQPVFVFFKNEAYYKLGYARIS